MWGVIPAPVGFGSCLKRAGNQSGLHKWWHIWQSVRITSSLVIWSAKLSVERRKAAAQVLLGVFSLSEPAVSFAAE